MGPVVELRLGRFVRGRDLTYTGQSCYFALPCNLWVCSVTERGNGTKALLVGYYRTNLVQNCCRGPYMDGYICSPRQAHPRIGFTSITQLHAYGLAALSPVGALA